MNSHIQKSSDVIFRIENLKKYFPVKQGVLRQTVGWVRAVDDVSFEIYRGETLGLVGESGCGKTTLGRTALLLNAPTAGNIYFEDHELTAMSRRELRQIRKNFQIVFQDPFSSLNPRMNVGNIVGEPLAIHNAAKGKDLRRRVESLLDRVGLDPRFANRFPHEFSGGQRQRIGIARALALNPSFVVADEPITSLDVSIQAQVINLLEDLQDEFDLTYLFITHDFGMIRHVSDRVAVMYLGKIVELANVDDLYTSPKHPYTQALLSAIPVPDPEIEETRQRVILTGDVPSPASPPPGCNFSSRCPIATARCSEAEPEFKQVMPDHWAACFCAETVEAAGARA